jgi:serine/threonine protein kinase
MGTNSEHATVAGTTIYMAPEVMQAGNDDRPTSAAVGKGGEGGDNDAGDIGPVTKYGRKADIWSLGMTLVELATGTPPYKNAAAAIYAVCVSKKFPAFPEHFTNHAHDFLTR